MSRSVWKLFHSTSLKQTLTRQLFLGLFLMLIVLIVIVHFSVKALTREFVQSRLQHDIDSLVAALTLTSDGEWMVEEERITAVYHRPYSGHYFIVRSDDVEFRSRSLWDIAVPGGPVQTALSGTAMSMSA
ncbi:sensor histidine kinase [Reinekea sp. MED297]|nr:sensor histidine kinase [Reinekea sp. MED297] [Reinekea blandensis MED297]